MRALIMRSPTEEEYQEIERLGTARTAPAAQVQRARLLKALAQGQSAPKAASLVGVTAETARRVLKHFNADGLGALEDRPRSGRKRVLTEEARGMLVLLAKSRPEEVLAGVEPGCHWTLHTLQQAASKEGIRISQMHLGRILRQEGIRWWRRPRSWLVSPDPELPAKRGKSPASIPTGLGVVR
jgi:transposase